MPVRSLCRDTNMHKSEILKSAAAPRLSRPVIAASIPDGENCSSSRSVANRPNMYDMLRSSATLFREQHDHYGVAA